MGRRAAVAGVAGLGLRRSVAMRWGRVADVSHAAALDLDLMSVRAMQSQGWGGVVAITSLSVRQPMPQLILSNTARAGATAFLKTLERECDGMSQTTSVTARPVTDVV